MAQRREKQIETVLLILSSPLRGEVAGAKRKSIGVIGEAKAALQFVPSQLFAFLIGGFAAAPPPPPLRSGTSPLKGEGKMI